MASYMEILKEFYKEVEPREKFSFFIYNMESSGLDHSHVNDYRQVRSFLCVTLSYKIHVFLLSSI
jgi:hypothetical protein